MNPSATGRARYLRQGRREAEPETVPCDYVPETEAQQARRELREWLRDRPDEWDGVETP